MNKRVCIIRFISNYLFSKIHILMVKPHRLQIKTHKIGKMNRGLVEPPSLKNNGIAKSFIRVGGTTNWERNVNWKE